MLVWEFCLLARLCWYKGSRWGGFGRLLEGAYVWLHDGWDPLFFSLFFFLPSLDTLNDCQGGEREHRGERKERRGSQRGRHTVRCLYRASSLCACPSRKKPRRNGRLKEERERAMKAEFERGFKRKTKKKNTKRERKRKTWVG